MELLNEKNDKLQKVLPELENYLGKNSKREPVVVYTGDTGYKSLEEDILATLAPNSVLYAIPAIYRVPKLASTFIKFIHKRRVDKKIILRAIYNSDEQSIKRAKEVRGIPMTEVREASRSNQIPAGLNIYGRKCAITVVDDNEEPIIIVFDSVSISETFKKFFDALWREAKPVKP